ncbi:MAG: helix-turn-helix domain-containing protein [Pedobacter sp.]|nr:helix-turn-helix domain-containing protein [Pedobacter sp.]MDQ8051877.1 helix-turn-helix domain-containing protein [Pedobacter sp.]
MANLEVLTKEDLEQFKKELFAELRRPGQKLHQQSQQKEWLKSFEVRKLLGISPGTLQALRKNGTIRFSKIGGLMFYKYDDIASLMN